METNIDNHPLKEIYEILDEVRHEATEHNDSGFKLLIRLIECILCHPRMVQEPFSFNNIKVLQTSHREVCIMDEQKKKRNEWFYLKIKAAVTLHRLLGLLDIEQEHTIDKLCFYFFKNPVEFFHGHFRFTYCVHFMNIKLHDLPCVMRELSMRN